MDGILVKKGDIETRVRKDRLKNYLANGWVEVKKESKPKPKTYDDYTVSQLKDIAKNRNIYIKAGLRKQEIIDILLYNDNEREKVSSGPSNQGFTDNLIKE